MSTPLVRFVIGGAQKGGTTALATFLGRHPGVSLPDGKEAHVFDMPDFDDAWDVAAVNRCYAGCFSDAAAALHGDATPIYLLHPRFISRIHRYNPDMRWIVLLRHPVERALSQYHMERGRGLEHLPLWLALLAERWRLAGHRDDFSRDSPLRHHSYRLRGDYATQLDVLYSLFPAQQVLLLRSNELLHEPAATMSRVQGFLGLPAMAAADDHARIFEGAYPRWPVRGWRYRCLCWCWRNDLARQRRYGLHWGEN
jgi:hypothetical protein